MEELKALLEEKIEQRKIKSQEWLEARLSWAQEYLNLSESLYKPTVAKIEAQADINTGGAKERTREELITLDKEIEMLLALMKGKTEE